MRARLFLLLAMLVAVPAMALLPGAARADAETEIARANDAFDQRNFPLAITHFSNALKQTPLSNNRRAYVYLRRGRAYFFAGQYENAAQDHLRAVGLNRDYYTAYWYLGLDYERLKKYGDAIDAHSRAVQIKPDFYQAYIDRGNNFLHLGEFREALADYETALAIRPNYAIGWNNRGVAYARLGNRAEAARSYRRAIQIDPNYTLARENLKKAQQE